MRKVTYTNKLSLNAHRRPSPRRRAIVEKGLEARGFPLPHPSPPPPPPPPPELILA